MDPVLVRFLEKFPTAAATAAASIDEVARVAGPLGLQERRPVAIIRFSRKAKILGSRGCFCPVLRIIDAVL